MPPRRLVSFASIGIHAVVIAALVIAQLFTVGPLPVPHAVLAYQDMTLVRIADIPLPAAQRHSASPPASASVAPIEAPSTVAPESAMPSTQTSSPDGTAIIGIENGVPGGVDGLGSMTVAAPPPPPPPPQQMPVRLHSGMQPPQKVVHVAPRYPAVAQAAHVQGVVILEAVIDAAGAVQSVHVLRSIPLLDQAAIDAVRQWQFTPTLLNGRPVPIILTVTMNFTLQDR